MEDVFFFCPTFSLWTYLSPFWGWKSWNIISDSKNRLINTVNAKEVRKQVLVHRISHFIFIFLNVYVWLLQYFQNDHGGAGGDVDTRPGHLPLSKSTPRRSFLELNLSDQNQVDRTMIPEKEKNQHVAMSRWKYRCYAGSLRELHINEYRQTSMSYNNAVKKRGQKFLHKGVKDCKCHKEYDHIKILLLNVVLQATEFWRLLKPLEPSYCGMKMLFVLPPPSSCAFAVIRGAIVPSSGYTSSTFSPLSAGPLICLVKDLFHPACPE